MNNIFNLQTAEYIVCEVSGFTLSEAMRFWRAKFETIQHFQRDVTRHPSLQKLGEFVAEEWNNIAPITVQEALLEKNLEIRRVMFDCIGVAKLFQELKPELLDKQVIEKAIIRWNEKLQPYEYRFQDTYELFRLDGDKLFTRDSVNTSNPVYAVRCWCTTTAREYWIYIPEQIAVNVLHWQKSPQEPDAIRSIAWTIRLDVSKPKRIFRQGDIIVVEESEDSQTVTPYHLTKEQYLQLMYSET